ncbi:MAG: DUF2283 domain-containing protein [Chloroflexi bacterium]|jgi:uncharacterized protein YuzE|nr:DUF2283 domain-containing protein [Chloroflexota bacterium]
MIEYHSDTDMLYIRLAEGTSVESEEIEPGIVLDFDQEGRPIGIEVEDASQRIDPSLLKVLLYAHKSAALLYQGR